MILRNFWYARHDLSLRGINFEPYRTVFIKTATPVGVAAFMVRPTRFERATYRVGVFRRILIKCCVFKGCAVFTDNTRFLWISRKPLKTLGKLAFSISSAIVVKQ